MLRVSISQVVSLLGQLCFESEQLLKVLLLINKLLMLDGHPIERLSNLFLLISLFLCLLFLHLFSGLRESLLVKISFTELRGGVSPLFLELPYAGPQVSYLRVQLSEVFLHWVPQRFLNTFINLGPAERFLATHHGTFLFFFFNEWLLGLF